ncbi:MAG: VWA domain-containing protein [Verrucomicrobiia bacterium]
MRTCLAAIALLSLVGSASQAQFSASSQTNIISGVISNWSGNYTLGYSYDSLQLSAGASLNDGEAFLEGGFDSVSVTGSNTVWGSSAGPLVGHNSDSNALTVSNGGGVNGIDGEIGDSGSTNSVVVVGAKSTWDNYDALTVGHSGVLNSLIISNGGVVNNYGQCFIGNSGANNSIQVSGSSSVLSNTAELQVGYSGNSNILTVVGGKVFDGAAGAIGTGGNDNFVGIFNHAQWVNSGDLYIGENGSGNSLVVSNGSTVSDNTVWMGYYASDYSNSVLITDPGSLWSNNFVYVGYGSATNSLTISNSATLYTSQLIIHDGCTFTASTGNIVGNEYGSVAAYFNGGINWLLDGTVFSAAVFSNAGTIHVTGSTLYLKNIHNDVNVGVLNVVNGSLTLSNSVLINNGTINAVYGNINLYNGSSLTNAGGTILTSNNIPVITSISVTGADVQIAFQTGMGGQYGVEYTDDITSGNWSVLQDGLTGTNGVLTVVDTGAALLPQRFYHALLHLSSRVPVIMTLVLDHSYSMCPTCIGSGFTEGGEYLPAAVASFITNFVPDVDEVAVVSFGSTATNDVPMTGNFQSVIPTAVSNIVWAGGTCSMCGLTNALNIENSIGSTATAVKVVVFFTDGLANMIEATAACPTGVPLPWNFGGFIPSQTECVDFFATNLPATYVAQECGEQCSTLGYLGACGEMPPSCCNGSSYQSFDGTQKLFTANNVVYDATNRCILVAKQMQQAGMYVFCVGLSAAENGDVPEPGFLQQVANDPASPTYNPALPTGQALVSGDGADISQLFQQIATQVQLRSTR